MPSETAGITTSLIIGYMGAANSFHYALVFVAMHGLVAVLIYWLLVGKIERFTVSRPSATAHDNSPGRVSGQR